MVSSRPDTNFNPLDSRWGIFDALKLEIDQGNEVGTRGREST